MTRVNKEAGSRRERRKAATREQIVSTAVELFSRLGIDAVTVDQIAEAADIGKGTIYNYFATKEDIVVAFMAELEAKVQAEVERLSSSEASLSSALAEYIRFQFRLKEPYHAFVRVFLGQMFLRTEQLFPYMVEMQAAIDPPLEALLAGLQLRGLIRADLNVPDFILIFKTMHLGLTAMWAIEGPPFQVTERLLVQEMTLLCEGLEPRQ